ncbi:VOC family protein [Arthrobacter sulfonylureivorans]|uniref:VOC family protein n=1 Tax=Arthrobacter sulfonylureivorans TaxID=2486855 RepID=A0ABY3WH38_9MICC|nr:VOC family protein [Arthrobacter sulfonylureivorans]UNK47873.1 VOC family protein [Arthrobacter sulfonylureivorans]
MSHVVEFLTVNVAVTSLDVTLPIYRALGLTDLEPSVMPELPIAMTDITLDVPGGTGISLISPHEAGLGPVGRFLDKRGEGVYSIALRVDDIEATMEDWAKLGLRWAVPEPIEIPGGRAARYVADRALLNWALPKELGGVLLEVVELRGEVRVDQRLTRAEAVRS